MSNHKYERLASNEEEMEEPKNTIQTPSTSSNASSSTDGITIDHTQDDAAIKLYLKQLENMSEEELGRILTQQTKDDWSVGMFITRHQGAATTQAYLQLLENALINKKLTSEQLTTILTQQNKEGWSIGMFIIKNNDNTTIQHYLQLLENALINGKLTSEQVTTILTQQTEDRWSIGMSLVNENDKTTTQQYLKLLENALINEKLTPKQLTTILTQQNKNGWSTGMFIIDKNDKTTTKEYEILKKSIFFMQKIKKIFSLLEAHNFKKSLEKLKDFFLRKGVGFTDSRKFFLNNIMENLISVFNDTLPDQKMKDDFFALLKNVSTNSLFYTSALISRLKFEALDSATLNTISFKLDELAKTHFDYEKGQRALADYYIGLFSQGKRELTSHELLQFLIHAQRCTPPHVMLDAAYGMLKNHFNADTEQGATSSHISLLTTTAENFPSQDNESEFDILLKTVLKKLVSLLSNNSFALKKLENILNQRNKDILLDFYLERILFQDSSETKNTSIFFKLATLPLQSRKTQITPEQHQELETLIPSDQQHNNARASITGLIDDFNQGKTTQKILLENLRNIIKEENSDYLEKTKTSPTPKSF